MNLTNGTLLQGGKYKIERVLGQGGFGITYLATQVMLNRQVAIKEFFFRDFNLRGEDTKKVTIATEASQQLVERYRHKFVKEAQTISGLDHPGVVRIHDIFEENGTAYYVMEYLDGETLAQLVKRRGAVPETEALGYIQAVADALQYIHAKHINHLDIKPANIIRRSADGRVVLIDFGVSKQYDATTDQGTTTTPVGISHGYSPAEQYRQGGVQQFSPQSDVYALAATLFKLLTGVTPHDAIEVITAGLPRADLQRCHVTQPVIDAIAAAMRPHSSRTPTVAQFIAQLSPSPQPAAPQSPTTDETTDVTIVKGVSAIEQNPVLAHRTFNVGGVTFKMIAVEGGTFMMGATSEQGNMALDDEKPAHRVTLSGYLIGETQVTQAMWMAVMGYNPSWYRGKDNRPVEQVSWDDCQEFISKLNVLTGEHFRLPTEAEWEYAARGGNRSCCFTYAGSNNLNDVAWYDGNTGWMGFTSTNKPQPVAAKAPNELGLYDMSGNVWEWCQDWYSSSYDGEMQTNPTGPATGFSRVCRGGCWISYDGACRVSRRQRFLPGRRDNAISLRLAL